jgi:hypothetical protein
MALRIPRAQPERRAPGKPIPTSTHTFDSSIPATHLSPSFARDEAERACTRSLEPIVYDRCLKRDPDYWVRDLPKQRNPSGYEYDAWST